MHRALVLFAYHTCAFALNPELDVNQYAHKAWTIRDGTFKGRVTSIAQTPDGYLWLGTEFGLVRFDGIRVTPWEPPRGQHLESRHIRRIMTARDGTLWIGTVKELVSWKNGKLTRYPEFAGRDTYRILEDREGSIWAGGYETTKSRICAIQKSGVRCYGDKGEFEPGVSSLYEDRQGNLWAGIIDGIWRLKPGPREFYPVPDLINGVAAFAEEDNGTLLLGASDRIERFFNGRLARYPLPGVSLQSEVRSLLRDRDGGLWIGTRKQGLFHVHQGKTDPFAPTDGLSGGDGQSLFEDREGNIWVVTEKGLDRFRDFAISTFSKSPGLPALFAYTALAASDGSVWMTTGDGLKRWNGGAVTAYRQRPGPRHPAPAGVVREVFDSGVPDHQRSLFQDRLGRIWIATGSGFGHLENDRYVPVPGSPGGNVYSIVEDSGGNLWMAVQDIGLIRISPDGEVQQISRTRLGFSGDVIAILPDSQGGIWLGHFPGGLTYFKDGQVRTSYSAAEGLGKGMVKHLRLGRDGAIWASTEGGLSRLKDGHITTLSTRHGLACDTVHWSIEDDDHSVWLYTACGLLRIVAAELSAWADSGKPVHATLLDNSDGAKLVATSGFYTPQVSKAPDGKIWFSAMDEGISVIDPHHLSRNRLPPPVHIERAIADRKSYDLIAPVRLPALTRELQIDYTALSLADPEKNQFRYRLEGYDSDWQEAGTRRQAFYTNLGPRKYRFRVMASNNSGVWNPTGASLEFSVAPAYYQTAWFLALCAAAALLLLGTAYRLRLRYLEHQFNVRLEARVGERTRIARDLHDTLLQSFQGILLKFSALQYMILDRPSEAVESLERIVEQARAAITEGRDAVQGLRSSTVVANDLARAITTFGDGLSANYAEQNCPEFRVHVEGKSRNLPPLVRDEIYHIACESLRNAFRHADAQRIEVEVRYDPRYFRLRVVDNGKGIDPAVLSVGGRAGHHGLPGILERAELAGGKLSVWSQPGSGAEIELTIPASIAYLKSPPARPS